MSRRVVVTGIGLVYARRQRYTRSTWKALCERAARACGPITVLRCQRPGHAYRRRGARISTPSLYMDRKEVRRNDRFVHYAMAASQAGAGGRRASTITEEQRRRCRRHHRLGHRRPERLPRAVQGALRPRAGSRQPVLHHACSSPTSPPAFVSMAVGARGPNFATVSACATGANAIGEAAEMIRRGDADGDARRRQRVRHHARWASRRSPACTRSRAATTTRRTPAARSTLTRDGFVMGEGAGVLLLEDEEHARKRGARIYAEMVGYASTADAYHITEPLPAARASRAPYAARWRRPASRPTRWTTSTRTARRRSTTTATRRRRSRPSSASTPQAGDQLDQVHDRPHARRGWRHRGGGDGAHAAHRHRSRRRSTSRIPTQNATWTTCRTRRARPRCRSRISNSMGFGGHNAVLAFRKYVG